MGRKPKSIAEYVVDSETGCWEWQRVKNSMGYGQMTVDKRMVYAHRVYWSRVNGPIPEGMCILHRCDNPGCVNPEHLWVGTQKDNQQDMVRKGRWRTGVHPKPAKHTHCQKGHEYTPENTYVRPDTGTRLCRICLRAERARYRNRHRAHVNMFERERRRRKVREARERATINR